MIKTPANQTMVAGAIAFIQALFQIFFEEMFYLVEGNDVRAVVQIRMTCTRNNNEFLVLSFQKSMHVFTEIE